MKRNSPGESVKRGDVENFLSLFIPIGNRATRLITNSSRRYYFRFFNFALFYFFLSFYLVSFLFFFFIERHEFFLPYSRCKRDTNNTYDLTNFAKNTGVISSSSIDRLIRPVEKNFASGAIISENS